MNKRAGNTLSNGSTGRTGRFVAELMIALSPLLPAPCHSAPATLPAGEALTWGKEPIESKTSRRATICLNGIWQVMPAIAEANQQPTNDLGLIRVPGGWQPGGTRMPGIVEAGTGGVWKSLSTDQVSRMWYQRTVNI